MKKQLVFLSIVTIISILILTACTGQTPTKVVQSLEPVAILVLDDYVDEVMGLSAFQWQEYEDKVKKLFDEEENCVYNLSGQAATISTGAAATISTGAGGAPLPAPHGWVTFEELRSVVRRAQDPNTGQLANTDEQVVDAAVDLGLDWIKTIVHFENIESNQTIALIAVDVSDYETNAIVKRLSETINKLSEKGYKRFVINMSFVIIPCSFFKDSQEVFTVMLDEYQKLPSNDPQFSYFKGYLVPSIDQSSISFSIKDETIVLTKLATPNADGNYFMDRDGNSITSQGAGTILGFNPVLGPVRLLSYYKSTYQSDTFEEVLNDPLRKYIQDLSQQYTVIPVASAGNQGLPYPFAPAMWNEVLSVSSPINSIDDQGFQVSNFIGDENEQSRFRTNSGEVVAEGCTNYVDVNGSHRIPGTSFAAPKVSYLAALYLLQDDQLNCMGTDPVPPLGYANGDGTWANMDIRVAANQYCSAFPAYIDLGNSCAEGSAPAPESGPYSPDPTTFVSARIDEPETLDPALDYETAGEEVIQNVYETLVFYEGEATDRFVPQLADSWEISRDGSVYTFHIRPGVKFHDGADLTASDVAYSFQRGLLFGGYAGPQWLMAEPFFGIGIDDISIVVDGQGTCTDDRECLKSLPTDQLLAACEKVTNAIIADDYTGTVTMTLAQPWGPFLATIAQPWGSVMDRDWAVTNGAWDGSCYSWQYYYAIPSEEDPLSTIMNGTGPFKLDYWTQGQEIVLTRNENYWREPAKLERVIIKSVDDWNARFVMMQTGEADQVAVPAGNRFQLDELVGERCEFNVNANKYEPCEVVNEYMPLRLLIGQPGISRTDLFLTFQIANTSPYVGSGWLDGNGIPLDFFSDVHIRKAFAYCFDWNTYIDNVFYGEAVQLPVIPLPGMTGYQTDMPVYSYDPTQCEAEFKMADLDKDGIPAGDDPEGDVWTTGFRMQALYNQGNTSRQTVSEILASNISEVNYNFVIEPLGLPWPVFLSALRTSEAPYFVYGWREDIHDPHNWYVPYMTGTHARRQKFPAELRGQFKDLINKGVSTTDAAERQAIYEELNRLYYDQVPTILLAVATNHGFEQRWVHGAILNPIFPGNNYYTIYKK